MKRFELGMWMVLVAPFVGLMLVFLHMVALQAGRIYVMGHSGNPMWRDVLFATAGPAAVALTLLGLVLMYGGRDQ